MKVELGPWIARRELGPEGRSYQFDTLSIWSDPAAELGICLKLESIRAEVFVLVQREGFYVRGSLKGIYSQPCVRCLELARINLARHFELFEECVFPVSPDRSGIVREEGGEWSLNIHAILWEQLVLDLPQRVLCRENCLGLCPKCGINLNKESCSCVHQGQDPRMEILRKLKL